MLRCKLICDSRDSLRWSRRTDHSLLGLYTQNLMLITCDQHQILSVQNEERVISSSRRLRSSQTNLIRSRFRTVKQCHGFLTEQMLNALRLFSTRRKIATGSVVDQDSVRWNSFLVQVRLMLNCFHGEDHSRLAKGIFGENENDHRRVSNILFEFFWIPVVSVTLEFPKETSE